MIPAIIPHLLDPSGAHPWQQLLAALVLTLIRVAGIFVFAPPFNSTAIPARIKTVFAFAIALLLAPLAAGLPRALPQLGFTPVLGEVAISFLFGFTLTLLNEAVLFASALLGISFSFSLANLMDPNSRVETPVIGTLLSWLATLVLFAAGLDHLLLAAILRSFTAVPLGSASLHTTSAHAVMEMAGGIFLAGLQLAAPVLATAMLVEIAVALVSRLAPSLPVQVVGIPCKTLVSYGVLISCIAVWPRWIERDFARLLDAAERLVTA